MALRRVAGRSLVDDPLWYKDAVFYEVHVRAFHDSNDDGVGDFPGLTSKLDYLQDLGVTTIWLLPFYPSPLRDDGYDIADYTAVHPAYGTLNDFRVFLREAHRRGLRVITELVLNHTSDQHPWFQRARHAPPSSRLRDFYVWSDSPDRYRDARIIFQDFETSNWTWDPVARAYYWHRFYSHQPDLNFDNPRVGAALKQVLDFWLDLGVDGLRLDAVPYLYEREGTNCENLPETHDFLRELRAHVESRYSNRMLLAEANQWPEHACAYFGAGNECHMAFHFPVMPRLFMALQMEDRFPIIDILEQTPAIPDGCQWAMFLRNHDELTLEMVTDEERDYMYRVYAEDPRARLNLGIRRRLAPLLGNNRQMIELMNGLLFSFPGTPIIYSGDEIGMGDNYYLGDRNGVRTPMQWNSDRNGGFSRANPHKLFLPTIIDPAYHYLMVNVETQQGNVNSLLWWMKRLIDLRRRHQALGRGSLELLQPDNKRVLAYVRQLGQERVLVVANLSRFVQYVELPLAAYEGLMPVELFGSSPFPPIGPRPYPLTLGPHSFYWLALTQEPLMQEPVRIDSGPPGQLPTLDVDDRWQQILDPRERGQLEQVLPGYLKARRWFGGKSRRIDALRVEDVVPVPHAPGEACFTFIQLQYGEGEPELYVMPLGFARGERAERLQQQTPHAVIAELTVHRPDANETGLLYSAYIDPEFWSVVLGLIHRRRRLRGDHGEIAGSATRLFGELRGHDDAGLEPSVSRAEQSNTSVLYGQRLILKLFRRLNPGLNPDLELTRFLTERGFAHIAPLAGQLEYRRGHAGPNEPATLALLQGYVANSGDAWTYTLEELGRFGERVLGRVPGPELKAALAPSLLTLSDAELPQEISALLETYGSAVRLLGERTAQLHQALASAADDPVFAPEPMSLLYQRSLYQSMRSLAGRILPLLHRQLPHLTGRSAELGTQLVAQEQAVHGRFARLLEGRIHAQRIRCHGDFHLGQVLHTGRDFVIIDFEGEPARSLGERRIKRSALRDVAGMLRSFHYAAHAGLLAQVEQGLVRAEDVEQLEPWHRLWYRGVAAAYLRAYRQQLEQGPVGLLPSERRELQTLLEALVLEKAVYEVGYELNNRPAWVWIPLAGILELLGSES